MAVFVNDLVLYEYRRQLAGIFSEISQRSLAMTVLAESPWLLKPNPDAFR